LSIYYLVFGIEADPKLKSNIKKQRAKPQIKNQKPASGVACHLSHITCGLPDPSTLLPIDPSTGLLCGVGVLCGLQSVSIGRISVKTGFVGVHRWPRSSNQISKSKEQNHKSKTKNRPAASLVTSHISLAARRTLLLIYSFTLLPDAPRPPGPLW
jgi:hypothetical protein